MDESIYDYYSEDRLGGFEMTEDEILRLTEQGWELYVDSNEINGFDPTRPALREGQVASRYMFRRPKIGG